MYHITDAQIDYILSDIRRNGVEMEDLQLNLLDHVCCIIERELKDGDDFGRFYHETIKQFYKQELREIEVETIQLLTFKNYYAMKKTMIASGTISAILFVIGSFFKIMYWPGAGVLLFSGTAVFALLFLPLMFILKSKEAKTGKEKFVTAMGFLIGILVCMGTIFSVQHWPGANVLRISAIALAMFVFIPMYFLNGIRNPEKKTNTILISIVLVGFTALQFVMVGLRKPPGPAAARMYTYLQDEQLLARIQRQNEALNRGDSRQMDIAADINNVCNELKTMILQAEIGMATIPADFEQRNLFINEYNLDQGFFEHKKGMQLLAQLKSLVDKYNSTRASDGEKLPVANTILDVTPANVRKYTNISALTNLTQLQMYLASSVQHAVVVNK
jgi:hypothetical protein